MFPNLFSPHLHEGLWLAGTAGKYQSGTSQGRSITAATAGMEHGQDWGCEVLLIWMYHPGLILGQGCTTCSSWSTCSTLPFPTHTACAPTQGRLIPRNSFAKEQFLPMWPGWPAVPGTSGWHEVRMSPGEQHGCTSPPSVSWDTAPLIARRAMEAGDAIL